MRSCGRDPRVSEARKAVTERSMALLMALSPTSNSTSRSATGWAEVSDGTRIMLSSLVLWTWTPAHAALSMSPISMILTSSSWMRSSFTRDSDRRGSSLVTILSFISKQDSMASCACRSACMIMFQSKGPLTISVFLSGVMDILTSCRSGHNRESWENSRCSPV